MDVKQICDAEVALNRIANAMRNVQSGFVDNIDTVQTVMQEVRHFVICWEDVTNMQYNKGIDPDEARSMRQASIDRLVIALTQ